ncbi:MAG: hypothetical protein ACLT98_04295 [Eggerthellaceae bacterium]
MRCDEWALKRPLTYEMLAGENRFWHPISSALKLLSKMRSWVPSLRWDELDPAVDDVIFFALDPTGKSYATVADFAEELEPFLGRSGSAACASFPSSSVTPTMRRKRKPRPRPPVPYVPLRERITPLQRTVAAHAAGALGSGAVAFRGVRESAADQRIRQPACSGAVRARDVGGALKPHLGALLAYFALSAALIAGNAPAAGCVLLAATAAWWYFTGRLGDADANATLVPPLAGAFGCNQLAPLVAGFCLPPARAFGAWRSRWWSA